jgi:hypothetical protein
MVVQVAPGFWLAMAMTRIFDDNGSRPVCRVRQKNGRGAKYNALFLGRGAKKT